MLDIILLLAWGVSASMATPTSLAARAADGFCTFWTESSCTIRSGSVNYDSMNDGILQNGGPYFNCAFFPFGEISLLSYPAGDSDGTELKHCQVFTETEVSSITADACVHLDDYGFTTGDGGYYRISQNGVCPTISERDANLTERAETWLSFYDDPECSQRSGSVAYDTENQGCFENGGAYMNFDGEDYGWHLEQWSGVDNFACADTLETCVNGDKIYTAQALSGHTCIHVDDLGFHSGFGSYKIGRAGCV